jgi:cysteine desulfurase
VQGFGKLKIDLLKSDIDLLSISGHKVGALAGIGALFISRFVEARLFGEKSLFKPLFLGGTHERGFRPGTPNLIGAFSLGYVAHKYQNDEFFKKRLAETEIRRNRFEQILSDVATPNGNVESRISNTSNLYFPSLKCDLDLFLEKLSANGVCASGKSACSSGLPAPSRVLSKMFGESAPQVLKSARFSLSVDTTDSEIEIAAQVIKKCLEE